MKKLIYGAAVALLIGAASCGKSDGNADSAKFFSKTATDSLLTSFGELVGSTSNFQIAQEIARDSTISKDTYLKGVQAAFAADTTDAYMNGYILGLRMMQQLKTYHRMGLDVDSRQVLKAFKEAFLTDSLPSSIEQQMIQGVFMQWNDSLQNAQHAFELEQKMNSEEARVNSEKGRNFIAASRATNDSIKTTESGLGYKIIAGGDARKITDADRPVLKAVGRTADGRVFEQYDRRTTRVASAIPGMQEGLLMLGKGGKAVFYIPGELAYGVEAPERFGLGLNEVVVYEVEVVDLPEAAAPAAQPLPQGLQQRMQAPVQLKK